MYYAHSANKDGNWQRLSDHLKQVSERAEGFASKFNAKDDALLAGLLHDIGKYRSEFQELLEGRRLKSKDTQHSIYGALAASKQSAIAPAAAILGHHAGLYDCHELQSRLSDHSSGSQVDSLIGLLESERICLPSKTTPPQFLDRDRLRWEFYIRMLFSCLVDADYLDSEEHSRTLPLPFPSLSSLCGDFLTRIDNHLTGLLRDGEVNTVRNRVLEQCAHKGSYPPGFFTLTVPTGGGKTLSSIAFALTHAKQWNLDRIIVVIPYLSIIEQNAAIYRQVLDPNGNGYVVENHSAVIPQSSESEVARSPVEIAAENWDAPIIVTTSVQFIESLFASSPSKCRKLHNIARSVVIFDEVQTLPVKLLNPLLNILRELKTNYGTSFLFMTATQPAFKHSFSLAEGFKPDEVVEIVDHPPEVFQVLKRVTFHRREFADWEELASELSDRTQVLCVVNIKRHAYELWSALNSVLSEEKRASLIHLSSAMCPAHRLDILGTPDTQDKRSIRHRLANDLPCRLISTQVVEAGVDVDFPAVYRAEGPLDSIVQAAGRCNREGNHDNGDVIIFKLPDHSLPGGIYRLATNKAAVTLSRISLDQLVVDPELFGGYFTQLFNLAETDGKQIQEDREQWRFREVSSKAKVIEDDTIPLIVRYKEGTKLVDNIRNRPVEAQCSRFNRQDLRALQRYMVNVRRNDFYKLLQHNLIQPLLPNLELFVLSEACYHEQLGLLIDNHPMEDFVL